MPLQPIATDERQIPHGAQTHAELLRFRSAMDMCGDAIYLVDRTAMRFVDVNQTACARMGYSREELLQMGPQDLLTVNRGEIERLYDDVIAAGADGTTMESTARTRDGRESITELHRRALRIDDNWIIVSIARDVTRRKRVERALLESEARFRSLTEMSSDFYWESDAVHRLTNRASAEGKASTVSVFQQGAQIGECRWDVPYLSPTAAGWAAHRAELDAHRPFRDFALSRLGIDGSERHIVISGDPVFDAAGEFRGYRGVGTDVTARKRSEQAVREGAQRLRLIADNIPVMTAYWDANFHCSFASKAFAAAFGCTVEEVVGRHAREILGEEVFLDNEAHVARIRQGHAVTFQRVRTLKDGTPRHFEIRLVPDLGDQGKVVGCFTVALDITEHKVTEERIHHVAHHDSLTGLPNRLLFNDRLGQAISLAKRASRQFALLYLDLDRFKPVNDALGHSAGDELLRAVATRIGRQVRESDTVARVGGDEFSVILPDIAGREQAEIVARKIRAALATPFLLGSGNQSVDIGASIGIALYPGDALDADALVKVADAAMYRAKQASGGVASE